MISSKSQEVQAAYQEIDAVFKKYGLDGAVLFVKAEYNDESKMSINASVCFPTLDHQIISYNQDGVTIHPIKVKSFPNAEELADNATNAYVTMALVCAACAGVATNLMDAMKVLVPAKDPMRMVTVVTDMQERKHNKEKNAKPEHYGYM
jgi:hypothetical protein